MRRQLTTPLRLLLLLLSFAFGATASGLHPVQRPLTDDDSSKPETKPISVSLFSELERLARLVDISYCIGNTGVGEPFNCVSRCKEFPTLSLARTWNTGMLMGDSCGYMAVDTGERRPDVDDELPPMEVGHEAIVIAFRGTYSIANTVVDLSTVPQKYLPYPSPDHGGEQPQKPEHECTNCTVHQGFLESWNQARKLVLPELEELKAKYPSYPIHLVGHSLGGAVACLAGLELKVSLGYENVTVTTFGEPRVGNEGLVRFVNEVFNLDSDSAPEDRTYRRVTHSNDPVPLLPLDEWGYRSHAGELYITKQALYPSEKEILDCVGNDDPACSAEEDHSSLTEAMGRLVPWSDEVEEKEEEKAQSMGFPTRYKLWQLFFAHRDYFWRLGLCVPGGDPANWGRDKYDLVDPDEL